MALIRMVPALVLVLVTLTVGQVPGKLEFEPSTTQPANMRTLRLTVLEGGRAELSTVDAGPSTRPASDKPTTLPTTIPTRLTGAQVEPLKVGYRVLFDFEQPSHCLEINGGEVSDGVLTVKSTEGKFTAMLNFPRRISPPFSVTIRYEEWNDPKIVLFPVPDRHFTLACDGPQRIWTLSERADKISKQIMTLALTETNRTVRFKLPTNSLGAVFVKMYGDGEMRFDSIEYEGTLSPSWGVQVEMIDGKLVVKSVFEGPAMTAGVQAGDELLSIDGRPVRDVADALSRLSSFRIGDAVVFTFRRSGKTAKVQMIAD